MEAYKTIRSYFKVFDIRPAHFDKKCANSFKTWLILLVFILSSASICAFLFCEAQTFEEYANGYSMMLTMYSCVYVLVIYIWKRGKLFTFMANFDIIIQNSEYNLINSTN